MSCTNMEQKVFYINFLNVLNVFWIYGDIPEEWRTAIVIPVHKKGDRNNPDNYRGISLLNTGYKIYSKITAKRLTAIAEVLLLEEQILHGLHIFSFTSN